MAVKAGGFPGGSPSARADLFELLGKAVLSGVGTGLLLMLLTLALAASAQAMPRESAGDTIPMRVDAERVLAPSATEPWSGAPVLRPSHGPAGTGALWAIPDDAIPSQGTADPTDRAPAEREDDPEARIEPAVHAVRVVPAPPVSPVVRESSPVLARTAREEPGTDLQILLGVLALACAGAVALLGKTVSTPARISGRVS